ncbi:hypothetical protein L218DRAFT_24264 [Marasmius fiardii PR-910]|nr:hypothetical protein L218DRAFT_24264 [Marasmius fiardii PR-910]
MANGSQRKIPKSRISDTGTPPKPSNLHKRIQPSPAPNHLVLKVNDRDNSLDSLHPSFLVDSSFPRLPTLGSTRPSFAVTKNIGAESPRSQHSVPSGYPNRSLERSLSPIVFTSPTSSNRPLRSIRQNVDDSYHYSSSWKSSNDEANFDDSQLLRIGTPSPTPSPSPSPVSTRNNCRQEALTVSVTSPSIDEVVLPPQAMLTTLSLPGTLNDDSFSLNLPVPFETQSLSPYSNHEGSDAPMPLLTTSSEPSDFIAIPTSPSVSLLPSLRTPLENPVSVHAIRFPQFTHTSLRTPVDLSPRLSGTEERDSFSAADFANAVVMSSWGNDILSIEPVVASGNYQSVEDNVIEDNPRLQTETSASLGRSRRSVTFAEGPRRRSGILSRVKKLGNKFKIFLLGKPKPPHKYVLKRSISVQESSDVLDITGNQSSQILPRLEVEFGGIDLAGGLATRARRHRPSLTPETYTPTDLGIQEIAFRGGLNVNSPGASTTAEGSNSPGDQLQYQLAKHARPKTVNEIKAKRPFSFAAFSNSSAPPSSPNNRKRRPVSALVMASSRASISSGQGRTAGQHRGYVANHVVLPSRGSSYVPPPPGLPNPTSSDVSSLVPLPTVEPSPCSVATQTASERPKPKDTRRFSLSALSSFAAGLKQQGTWARYS